METTVLFRVCLAGQGDLVIMKKVNGNYGIPFRV